MHVCIACSIRLSGVSYVVFLRMEMKPVLLLCVQATHKVFVYSQAHGIDHLVIPTRDYLFAPSFVDIRRAVNFIHG